MAGEKGLAGPSGVPGSPGSNGNPGAATADSIYPANTPTAPSASQAEPPAVALIASDVNPANAASETPYQFNLVITAQGGNLVDVGSIAGIQVLPPSGPPVTAAVISTTPSGTTDALGDASLLTVTYQITPPGGNWPSTRRALMWLP